MRLFPFSFFAQPTAPPPLPGPDTVSGLYLWLSGDYGVYSDSGVTPAVNLGTVQQWNDRSGNGHNSIQGNNNPAQRFVYYAANLNGKPTLKSDGVNDFMNDFAGFTLNAPNTTFLVMNVYGGTYLIAGNSTAGPGYGEISAGGFWTMNAGNNSVLFNHGTLPSGFEIHTLVVDGGSSEIKINGVTKASGNAGAGTMYGNGLSLAGVNGGFNCEIDFAEVIIYDHHLSAGDQTTVLNYLYDKYALPPTHDPDSIADLFGWFDALDFNGSTWADRKSNMTAAVTSTAKVGDDAVFNGSSSFIDFGRQTILEGSGIEWTISFWFKTSAGGHQVIFYYDDDNTLGNTANNLYLYLSSSQSTSKYARITPGSEVSTGSTAMEDGVFHNFVITRDSSNTIKFYDNNVLLSTQTGEDISGGVSHILRIAHPGNVGWFNGMIDEMLFYTRAITTTEISTLFQSARGRFGV